MLLLSGFQQHKEKLHLLKLKLHELKEFSVSFVSLVLKLLLERLD